jgi:maltose alpha-D-glucosyltransferase/alpha-amylase
MHVALSKANNGSPFAPEPLSSAGIEVIAGRIRAEAAQSFDLLKTNLPTLPDDTLELAGLVLRKRRQIIDRLTLPIDADYGKRIRLHGDYHLGQVLRTKNDFVIVDFEGEPARPLEQRRDKHSPLKDVAGMLRSFSYAANAALMSYTARHPETFASLEPWARIWEVNVCAEFLIAYRSTPGIDSILPHGDRSFEGLLAAYRFEKAMYELSYELSNRPNWVRIPLAGILTLATT